MSDTLETQSAAIIKKLREYNLWRRGSDQLTQPNPTEIGLCLDAVCDIAERLERERDEGNAARKASAADWLHQVDQMGKCVAAAKQRAALAEKERDEANEELNKQLIRYDALFDEAEKIRVERDRLTTLVKSNHGQQP